MAAIKSVAVAGKGRIGTPVARALAAAGFDVVILTRSATDLKDVPIGAKTIEVDYDSSQSLEDALRGLDAVVSTVAMSAISNQKRMIDAAIAVGVKHFIPAEFTVESRDPRARWLPILSLVIDIQDYLIAQQGKIDWTVVNCGASMEFAFDPPFILDFDNHVARLWDGGNGGLSLSNFDIIASAVVGVLKQPQRVQNHGVHVHGVVLTQREALRIAQKYTKEPWSIKELDAEATIQECKSRIESGKSTSPEETLGDLITLISAATFGSGYFKGAYDVNDNSWLGVNQTISEQAIEEAIRFRVEKGKAGHASGETLEDVTDGMASKHREGK